MTDDRKLLPAEAEMEPTKRLYLDLDGVMADFDAHFPATFGLNHRDLADDDMWATINAHPSYFADMPPCAGAIDFFREIEHLRPIILTACPRTNYQHVARQKRDWVRRHLSRHVTILPVLGGHNKPLFMQEPGDVLIDDWRKNINAWDQAGGKGVLHRSFEETRSAISAEFNALTAAPKATETPGLREAVERELDADIRWQSFNVTLSDGKAFKHQPSGETEFITIAEFRRVLVHLNDRLRAALSATPQPVAVPDDRPYCAGALAHIEIGGLCERHVKELRDHADKLRWQMQNDDRPAPPHGWTCFHCAQTFTTWASAIAHFGDDPSTGTRPECVAVPDDGAGRDEALLDAALHAAAALHAKASIPDDNDTFMDAALEVIHSFAASALSAERAEVARLRKALEPTLNMEMWTETARDDDLVLMNVKTVRAMRAAARSSCEEGK